MVFLLSYIETWCFCAGSQATYSRPSMTPTIGARVTTSPGGATYVKTTSGSIITVVPKSLATLGGKILSSSMVSGGSLGPGLGPGLGRGWICTSGVVSCCYKLNLFILQV